MRRGVNIVAFGNFTQLIQSFELGWDVSIADNILHKEGIGWMLLPVRGLSKNSLKAKVLCYEDSWNHANFLPALKKLVGDLAYASKGSPTSQKGASALDRISGMNFHGNSGTIIDWLLFGTFKESFDEFQDIRRRYRDALETVHSLIDGETVIEVHPEFRREICKSQNISQDDFADWLVSQTFPICVDTFHLFQRGSRDGVDPSPVIPNDRLRFLSDVSSRIREVHFRLSKSECNQILEGKVKELPLYAEMQWVFLNCTESVFILEMYPDLFATQEATAKKVVKIWNILEQSFVS